jgi:hypothetical protein
MYLPLPLLLVVSIVILFGPLALLCEKKKNKGIGNNINFRKLL